jgi:hypothetical protein
VAGSLSAIAVVSLTKRQWVGLLVGLCVAVLTSAAGSVR